MENAPEFSVHVANLHPDVDEAILNEKFSTVGKVQKIHLCRNSTNYVSLGYAYVTFYSRKHAEEALDTLNFDYLMNRPMRMSWANSNSTLRKLGVGNIFIKNLHKDITDGMLYDTFVHFGEILSCKVALYDNNRSKGYGFVHYVTEEAANTAIEKVNGMSLQGKIVYVGLFKNKYERLKELGNEEPCFNNVYVKNFGEETRENELDFIFGKIGEVMNVKIIKDESGKSKGFGFVTFKHFDSAKNAVSGLNGKKILPGGKPLYVSRAIKHDERQEQLALKQKEHLKRLQNCKIYVGNLAESVDENRLREMFEEFGTIVSATVKLENGVSRGFGFVNFSSPQEAEKAISGMDGRRLEKNKLKVSVAEKKEEYLAFLNYQRLERLKNPHFNLNLHSFPVETETGSVPSNNFEQPGPSSLESETETKNVNRLDPTRRQYKKKNAAKAEPIKEESIPQNDNILPKQQGQLNRKDRKMSLKNASRKQEEPERTAVETTSSTTVSHPIKSRSLNGNVAKSISTNSQPSTSGTERLQYSTRNIDGQRDRRYARKPLTLGSFITFTK